MKKKLTLAVSAFLAVASCLTAGGILSYTNSNSSEEHSILNIVDTLTTAQNKTVQQKLKRWGYYNGAVDGIYGAKTKAAVKAFQRKNGLTADGIVGKKTAAALGMSISGSSSSSSSSTQNSSDLNLLAHAVYAEARGEPYIGQVSVAAVILNRVKSASFPNTISGVIYQPWAFSSVNDGQINLTPNQSAFKAAQDALNGWDPTYGCLYFYNATTSTSKWIYSRKTVVTYGKHIFAI